MAQEKVNHELLEGENILYIENDRIRLGVNLALGGAVTYLAELGRPNLINSFDWGRQVQMSFYSDPVPYEPAGTTVKPDWRFLGWNPIQSGDCYGHRSQVLEHRCTENEIYVRCIPMHWPMDNVPGECTFEVRYRLNGSRVEVTSCISNARPDTDWHPARSQEQPAVYTNGTWYKLVSYVGEQPFTGGEPTALCTKENGLGWPWIAYRATEHWAALVDDADYGLGVYNGRTCEFIGGFAGRMGEGGPKDVNTGYISPLQTQILDSNIRYEYSYALVVGTVEQIRRAAGEMYAADRRSSWQFSEDRQGFYYKDIQDAGWPLQNGLDFDFAPGGMLLSPSVFLRPGDASRIRVQGCFTGGEIAGTLLLKLYDGRWHERGYTFPEEERPFVLRGDGSCGEQVLELGELPSSCIGFALRFAGSGHAQIRSIALE